MKLSASSRSVAASFAAGLACGLVGVWLLVLVVSS